MIYGKIQFELWAKVEKFVFIIVAAGRLRYDENNFHFKGFGMLNIHRNLESTYMNIHRIFDMIAASRNRKKRV